MKLLKEANPNTQHKLTKKGCFFIHSSHHLFVLYKLQNFFKLSRYDFKERYWYNFEISPKIQSIKPLWQSITKFKKYQNLRQKYLKTTVLETIEKPNGKIRKKRKFQLFIMWTDTQYLIKITLDDDNCRLLSIKPLDLLYINFKIHNIYVINNNLHGYGCDDKCFYHIKYNQLTKMFEIINYIHQMIPQCDYDLKEILNSQLIIWYDYVSNFHYVLRWTNPLNTQLIRFNLHKNENIYLFQSQNLPNLVNLHYHHHYYSLFTTFSFFLSQSYIVFFHISHLKIILYNIKTQIWTESNSKLLKELKLNEYHHSENYQYYQQQFKIKLFKNENTINTLCISGFIRDIANKYCINLIPTQVQQYLIKKYYSPMKIELIDNSSFKSWNFDCDDLFH